MSTSAPAFPVTTDHQLWEQSRAGDREAFGQIVERYQSLVCSLAYSTCGSLTRSEDLAQETFLAAWQRLGDLREPGKLAGWLGGIVRNLSANAARREQRRGGPAAALEDVAEPATPEPDPAERAVSEEEAALLWRSLAGLPESYREPLVLFYRQDQSVAQVAEALELSEETVRQRLSRGRSMLRAELADMVESTLTRSRPGPAFTLAVLVALPLVSATSASAAVVIAGGAFAAGTSTGSVPMAAAGPGFLAKIGLAPFLGPLIGLTAAWFGTRAAASHALSEEERRYILHTARFRIIPFCLVLSLGLAAVLMQAGKMYTPSAVWIVLGVTAWVAVLLGGIFAFAAKMQREVERIRQANGTTEIAPKRTGRRYETKTRLLGLPLFAFAWNQQAGLTWRERAAVGWLAVGDLALSPVLAFGGTAIAPVAIGGVTVGVLSLSIFFGLAFGLVAVGGLAFGWSALGFVAAGWKCAIGFAAVAHDYAIGLAASAAVTGAPAKAWLQSAPLVDVASLLPWGLGLAVLMVFGLRAWR